jgi:hypothetical protein
MRIISVFIALALAACGQTEAPPPVTAPADSAQAMAAPPWFICDGIDQPVVFLFADAPDDGRVRVVQYDKATGASVFTGEVALGPGDGAAGSVYTPLLIDDAEAGHVRQINPGVLETPGAAFTPLFASLSFRNIEAQCRWLPRTRLMGFTGRRSIVVHEDADGDLIYTAFNFPDAATNPIELSENGRSTRFSAEVRDGQETLSPQGAEFRFTAADGYIYVVHAGRDGAGRIEVLRNGAEVQSEPLIAFVLGEAQE